MNEESPPRTISQSCLVGLAVYLLSSLLVLLGMMLQQHFVPPHRPTQSQSMLEKFTSNWDSAWYLRIAREGYSYDPAQQSAVAFFPAFPLAGRWLAGCTNLSEEAALLAFSHLCLLGTFITLAAYVARRFPDAAPRLQVLVLVSLALFPFTFYCRLAYSESLFLFVTTLALYGMHRKWPAVWLALLVGLATATRLPGLALVAVLALHLWREPGSLRRRALRLAWCLPLASWGLAAYMAFQAAEFGTPLAFAQTQENWQRTPSLPNKLLHVAKLQPATTLLWPFSRGYWRNLQLGDWALLSPHLANLAWFGVAVLLVAVGAARKWLSSLETVLAALLLLIPYLGKLIESRMISGGRYASVAVPMYLVAGQMLCRLPTWAAAAILALSGALMVLYTILFAAQYAYF